MDSDQLNLLEYMRSKTQVDIDSFDLQASREIGPCADCTSNQIEAYTELLKPASNDILIESIAISERIHPQFAAVALKELVLEVASIKLALRMAPTITGACHVMSNPNYSYCREMIVETGKRYYHLATIIDPSFDISRLVIKVPATWEGLQACRDLKHGGIKTLATTLFSMEQVILAGEVGCVSISPFVHELKTFFDETYHDTQPLLKLCVEAQRFYRQCSLPTKVKACATIGIDEILQLAGVDALTIVTDDLKALQSIQKSKDLLNKMSLFSNKDMIQNKIEHRSYLDNEAKYRMDFAVSERGKAQFKLAQTISIFSDFQTKAEGLVQVTMARST